MGDSEPSDDKGVSLKEVIERNTFIFLASLIIIVVGATITGVIYFLEYFDQRIRTAAERGVLPGATFPTSAVVAFTSPCSAVPGWSEYSHAQGRFLVAVGTTVDGRGEEKSFAFGKPNKDKDGEFAHVLVPSELPEHRHSGTTTEGDGAHIHHADDGSTFYGVKDGTGVGGNGGVWVSGRQKNRQ